MLDTNFYSNIDKNERFYAGIQWKGVKSNGLPQVTMNVFQKQIDYAIATLLQNKIVAQITSDELVDRVEAEETAAILTKLIEKEFERNKCDSLWRDALYDSAIASDACMFLYFDDSIETNQLMKGKLCMELIDNVNVFLGNPNTNVINKNGKPYQPYVLIAFREVVEDVRAEAKRYGAKDWEKINADADIDYQSGDLGKIELTNPDEMQNKCTVLLKMWSEDGTIKARKSTQNVIVRKEWDTKSTIYPLTIMNWKRRKNSWHGQALGTGLVPNQLIINKLLSIAAAKEMKSVFPTVIFDKSAITNFSNGIGTAIGVEANGMPLSNLVYEFQTNPNNASAMALVEMLIEYTQKMIGASDTALGNAKPENTSAILATIQQSAIPLRNVESNLYQFVEDIVGIMIDLMAGYYGERMATAETLQDDALYNVDFAGIRSMNLSIGIDVGTTSYWSELQNNQRLDNLLEQQRISFTQYLKRIPNNAINKLDALVQEVEAQEKQMQEQPQQGQGQVAPV